MTHFVCIPSSVGAARRLFDRSVSVAATDPRREYSGLMPEEAVAVIRAAPKRKREFAAGRIAARRAMAALGFEERSVPVGTDRAPIWPNGIVGGISHSDDICIAVAAKTEGVAALGIDVERATPLQAELWDTVLTSSDLSLVKSFPKRQRGVIAKVIFSAKECAYKCQYPISRKLFGFDAMDITLDIEGQRFWAAFTQDAQPFDRGHTLVGRYEIENGVIMTGITLEGQYAVTQQQASVINF